MNLLIALIIVFGLVFLYGALFMAHHVIGMCKVRRIAYVNWAWTRAKVHPFYRMPSWWWMPTTLPKWTHLSARRWTVAEDYDPDEAEAKEFYKDNVLHEMYSEE